MKKSSLSPDCSFGDSTDHAQRFPDDTSGARLLWGTLCIDQLRRAGVTFETGADERAESLPRLVATPYSGDRRGSR